MTTKDWVRLGAFCILYGTAIWLAGWNIVTAIFLCEWAHNIERH